jgi:hypothetical protein
MFQAHRDNAKMRETNGVNDVKYNEMDLLILDVLGKDNPSVEGLDGDDCFRLRRQLQISYRQSYLHLYCRLIYCHHLLSEIKIGTCTLTIDTLCMSPTK